MICLASFQLNYRHCVWKIVERLRNVIWLWSHFPATALSLRSWHILATFFNLKSIFFLYHIVRFPKVLLPSLPVSSVCWRSWPLSTCKSAFVLREKLLRESWFTVLWFLSLRDLELSNLGCLFLAVWSLQTDFRHTFLKISFSGYSQWWCWAAPICSIMAASIAPLMISYATSLYHDKVLS